MKIDNKIIKHYLKNVMFITGTAFAGKSTMVAMLAEKYGLIQCGENYHSQVADEIIDPERQPHLCYESRNIRYFSESFYANIRNIRGSRFWRSRIILKNFMI
jgi:deoxyadenosine/deoxycytidine kinase